MLVGLSPLRRRVGIGISPREVRKVFYFRCLEFWRWCRFCCAAKDAPLRNKGVGGCARRLAGGLQARRKEVHTSCLRRAHLLGEKFTSLDGRGHTAFPNEHIKGIYNPKRRFFDPVTFEIKYPFVQLK